MMSFENYFVGNEKDKFQFPEFEHSPFDFEHSELFNPFPSTPLSVFNDQSASPRSLTSDYSIPVTDLFNTSPLSSDTSRQTPNCISPARRKAVFNGYARPPEYAYQGSSGYSNVPAHLQMYDIGPDVSQFSASNDLSFNIGMTPTASQSFTSACKVCGDIASGNHFGVLSCEACKSFFRRSVRANNSYACRANRECAIEKLTRNRCQYCRFQKCKLMGMKTEVVQEERIPLVSQPQKPSFQPLYRYSYDQLRPHSLSNETTANGQSSNTITRSKKGGSLPNLKMELDEETIPQDLDSSNSSHCSIQSNDSKPVTPDQHPKEVSASILVNADLQTDIPPEKATVVTGNVMLEEIFEGARQSLLKIIDWVKQIPAFTALNLQDQMNLLKSSWFELVLMRLATRIRPESGSVLLSSGVTCFKDQIEDPEIRRIMEQVSNDMSYWFDIMQVDQVEIACLKGIILFNPDAKGLNASTRKMVEILQEQSLKALQTRCRTVHPVTPLRFSKLLLRLTPLKALALEAKQHMIVQRTLASSKVDNILCELLD